MRESWYDSAQICRNGHVINAAATSFPEMNATFCDRCGARAVSVCPVCRAPIRGEYHISGTLSLAPFSAPAYCSSCGQPFPWTEERIEAALALADEMEHLSPRERELLKQSIEDIVRDTPRSPTAITRFKRLVARAGRGAAESLREILVDIVSEAASKALWG